MLSAGYCGCTLLKGGCNHGRGTGPTGTWRWRPILNTPEMREIQLKKLKVFLRRLYDNAPFYTKQFDELGVVAGEDQQLRGFLKTVPLFDKEGLAGHGRWSSAGTSWRCSTRSCR